MMNDEKSNDLRESIYLFSDIYIKSNDAQNDIFMTFLPLSCMTNETMNDSHRTTLSKERKILGEEITFLNFSTSCPDVVLPNSISFL